MTLRQFATEFKNIGRQEFLRLDFGYRYFFDIQKTNVFSTKNNVKLRYILKPIGTKKVAKGELEEPEILVDVSNIERRFNNLINCEEVSEIGSEKNILQEGDIVIPKLQPQMGNFFLNLEHKKYIGSSELFEYKIATDSNPHFIYYLFTSKKFLFGLGQLESGKTHRRVNPTDLLKIKFPCIPKFIQDRIVAEIKPLENKIKEAKKLIKKPEKIVDGVLAKKFGFDLEKFEEDKEKKSFEADFSNISKNSLLRLSSHFHHKKLENVEEKLKNKDFWVPVSSIFKISGGKRFPGGRKFSDVETDYLYLRPAEVSVEGINRIDIPYLSLESYTQLKKYKIISGELCVSSAGTLGKTALIDTDELEIDKESLILSENFVKLTPKNKKNINNLFFFYFFYSFIFKAQADRECTITTIKKLGIDKWNYIKVPNIPLSDQEKIVAEIKNELDKQKQLKQEIESKRNKIDEIIGYHLKEYNK